MPKCVKQGPTALPDGNSGSALDLNISSPICCENPQAGINGGTHNRKLETRLKHKHSELVTWALLVSVHHLK